jgi:transposase
MARQKRYYTREFKLEAIRLAESKVKTIVEIEKDLGLSRGLLNRWKKEAQEEGRNAFPGSGYTSSEENELRRLQQENAILKQERDILKKAVAIFAQQK